MDITRSKLGAWFLLSLIPTGLLFLVAIVASSPTPWAPGELFWSFIGLINLFYLPSALVAGLVLMILDSRARSRAYKEALTYAQRNGWRPITKEMWRNRKGSGVQLAVNQAVGQSSYVLTIEVNGETTMVDEFATRVWALEFGDWLWEELANSRASTEAKVVAEIVAEKRDEWEQSRAIAVYKGPRERGVGIRKQSADLSKSGSFLHATPVQEGYTMQGKLLEFSMRDGGIVSGDDGQRYRFDAPAWSSPGAPLAGQRVDFDIQDGRALDVFAVLGTGATGSKSRVTAGLLAFFLGGLGGHKFYLGHTGLGILYIVLTFTIIGAFFTAPVSLIESLIYLTKSDEDFDRIYVEQRRAWF